jgi:hypothetical protein
VVFLTFPLVAMHPQRQKSAATDPLYSSVHSVIIPEHQRYTRKIASPDGQKYVTSQLVDGGEDVDIQRLSVNTAGGTFRLKTEGRGAEILWSPDSRWLAVTYTYCCSGFSPYLHVYEVSDSGIRDLGVKDALTDGFGKGIHCEQGSSAGEWALTAAVKWLDSSRLLAAVQVPNVSVCDSMGVFELREISVPNLAIARTYGQLEAKKLFGHDLGGNLRDARDACIRDPKSCWVASHH